MFINYTLVLSKKHTVICIIPDGFQYLEILKSNNIHFETIKIRNYYDIIASVKFITLYKKYNPKLIFSHNGRFNSVINISSLLFKINNKIAICHGDTKRLNSFSRTLAVNSTLEKTLLEMKIKNVNLLPNFIEIKKITKTPKKSKNNTFTFGVISRLSPEKSVIDAIKAIQSLPESNNITYKLIIAGTGTELDMLTSYIEREDLQDTVKFSGWVSNKDEFYSSIDCLVITSLFETFGLTILEAFNYSLPVISSRTNGPKEIIDDGINGLLFDSSNIKQLVSLMIKISNDPGLKNKIGDNGFSTLQHKYSKKEFESKLSYLLSNTK